MTDVPHERPRAPDNESGFSQTGKQEGTPRERAGEKLNRPGERVVGPGPEKSERLEEEREDDG